jgi:hypothetical protein
MIFFAFLFSILGDMKKLSNDLTNPWFNVLFDNKNTTGNLYGSIGQNKLTPYNQFSKIRYSTKFPMIPRPPRQKPWDTNSRRQPSSSEKIDTEETDSGRAVTKALGTTTIKTTKSDQASKTTLMTSTKVVKSQPNSTTNKNTAIQTDTSTTSRGNTQSNITTTTKAGSHSNTTKSSFTSTEQMTTTSQPLNKTMKEKNLYFMNSGVIHAGEIEIDVNGEIKHHHLSNDTLDEFEISTSGSGSPLSGSEFLFGAVFGLSLLVILFIGLLLFLFRTKLKRYLFLFVIIFNKLSAMNCYRDFCMNYMYRLTFYHVEKMEMFAPYVSLQYK